MAWECWDILTWICAILGNQASGRVVAGMASGVKMVGMMEVGALISLDGVASSRIVSASAFVTFPFVIFPCDVLYCGETVHPS